jgi:Family of unknown function (DUF6428)
MVPQSQPVSASGEMAAADLLATLARNAGKPLIFRYEGRDVLPGYHVTEVKAGAFQALDCGANPESWHETFVQLWDVPPEDGRGHMAAGKFLAIIRKVADAVPFDPAAKLTFEVSDGRRAMQLYCATAVATGDDAVRVELMARPASCKPRDRWLAQQTTACCAPGSAADRCCSPADATAGAPMERV